MVHFCLGSCAETDWFLGLQRTGLSWAGNSPRQAARSPPSACLRCLLPRSERPKMIHPDRSKSFSAIRHSTAAGIQPHFQNSGGSNNLRASKMSADANTLRPIDSGSLVWHFALHNYNREYYFADQFVHLMSFQHLISEQQGHCGSCKTFALFVAIWPDCSQCIHWVSDDCFSLNYWRPFVGEARHLPTYPHVWATWCSSAYCGGQTSGCNRCFVDFDSSICMIYLHLSPLNHDATCSDWFDLFHMPWSRFVQHLLWMRCCDHCCWRSCRFGLRTRIIVTADEVGLRSSTPMIDSLYLFRLSRKNERRLLQPLASRPLLPSKVHIEYIIHLSSLWISKTVDQSFIELICLHSLYVYKENYLLVALAGASPRGRAPTYFPSSRCSKCFQMMIAASSDFDHSRFLYWSLPSDWTELCPRYLKRLYYSFASDHLG